MVICCFEQPDSRNKGTVCHFEDYYSSAAKLLRRKEQAEWPNEDQRNQIAEVDRNVSDGLLSMPRERKRNIRRDIPLSRVR